MTDTELQRRKAICEVAGVDDIGNLSDGFHTFNGLYEQRMILFAALVNAYKDKSWKSYRHEDGEYCFGGGWFIVGIDTPEGSYTYHYENRYWNMFDCVDLPRAKHWDGHTEADAETRLMSLEPEIKTDGDTISRQKAIDALADMHCKSDEDGYVWIIRSDAWARIDALPSAQPEKRTNKRTETHACDLIDREAAVDAIYHHLPSVSRTRARTMLHEVLSAQTEPCGDVPDNNVGECEDAVSRADVEHEIANILRGIFVEYQDIAKKTASKLPSVTPEQKRGKWEDKSNGIEGAWNYCSVCGEQAIDLYDFCPNCGARMTGDKE